MSVRGTGGCLVRCDEFFHVVWEQNRSKGFGQGICRIISAVNAVFDVVVEMVDQVVSFDIDVYAASRFALICGNFHGGLFVHEYLCGWELVRKWCRWEEDVDQETAWRKDFLRCVWDGYVFGLTPPEGYFVLFLNRSWTGDPNAVYTVPVKEFWALYVEKSASQKMRSDSGLEWCMLCHGMICVWVILSNDWVIENP